MKRHLLFAGLLLVVTAFGCQPNVSEPQPSQVTGSGSAPTPPLEDPDILAERTNLSPEDRGIIDAQDYCPVMPDSRLGAMGAPFKLIIKDQTVFVCCKGCRGRALADPDKTLTRVQELKGKRNAGSPRN